MRKQTEHQMSTNHWHTPLCSGIYHCGELCQHDENPYDIGLQHIWQIPLTYIFDLKRIPHSSLIKLIKWFFMFWMFWIHFLWLLPVLDVLHQKCEQKRHFLFGVFLLLSFEIRTSLLFSLKYYFVTYTDLSLNTIIKFSIMLTIFQQKSRICFPTFTKRIVMGYGTMQYVLLWTPIVRYRCWVSSVIFELV